MSVQATPSAVLESVILKTLHAHSFSRSSLQASSILADILSRFLTILSSTCGKYAEHAGRPTPTVHDALWALDELGMSMDELSAYCSSEGLELGRYVARSAKRSEELQEYNVYLMDGLESSKDRAIPLVYAPLPEYDLPDEDDEESEDEDMKMAPLLNGHTHPMPPPPSHWNEKYPHVPSFLPPFPHENSKEVQKPPSPSVPHPVKVERPPSPLPQHVSSTAIPDYITQVSYSQSTLASQPEWHLPSHPPSGPPIRNSSSQTPSTHPSLIAAYHHILTQPPPHTTSVNPSKHKISMALLSQTQENSRWTAPDSLYSSVTPCPPRVTPIGPTYAVPLTALQDNRAGKDEAKEPEKRFPYPPTPPRPVFTNERSIFLASRHASRIPDLARQVLPGSVYIRTTRLAHPPALQRGTQKLHYGPGVNAPWNANSGTLVGAGTPTSHPNKDPDASGSQNGKEVSSNVLPDAQLFATWEYDAKHYQEALPVGRRSRVGTFSSPSVALSLGGRPGKSG
ncbi:hypothetical protein SERLA73DRAFT_114335 [Serpula lacrymans var. lacrymans S7.3]|uniref:Bromodomain associated domain-containing protein n=2 Tax=Serpula lacrymans var. lacrymans TaxID=341189 RepID=F8Q9X3_SERL3|nr:uncharacterized protein SERLADRAFT_363648 [Serpula lacrymans var. lacrymans S7.9]EGN94878.1 hypothetical protein SERLA73DRAFT_114335 [Serpula lacrymans var. lacrymans S7.3]EGO20371.1 hypothetical protein SERLADRAFT_363648 [Serpula lacrymans var. lacrymans S7.9]